MELQINGANYDPPGMNLYLSKSILFLKFVFIIVIMSSFDIWGYLGHAIPAWYRWCSENKLYACMMVFFVGNMLEAQVSQLKERNLKQVHYNDQSKNSIHPSFGKVREDTLLKPARI